MESMLAMIDVVLSPGDAGKQVRHTSAESDISGCNPKRISMLYFKESVTFAVGFNGLEMSCD